MKEKKILEAITKLDNFTVSDLVKETNLPKSTIYYYIKKLLKQKEIKIVHESYSTGYGKTEYRYIKTENFLTETNEENQTTKDTITIPESAIRDAAIDLFYKMRDELYELRKYCENSASRDEELINLRIEIQKFQENIWQQQHEIEKLKEQRKRILQEKEKEIEELKQEIQKLKGINPTGKFSFKVR